jgi:predicted MFS family arabinose efflux permease
VFSGVGVGIAAAGLACLALMLGGATARQAWIALGLAAAITLVALWPAGAAQAPASRSQPVRWSAATILLVACYGAFGFGYIIPATFLPAMAKDAIGDPALFGLAWPLFGAAAAASTLVAGAARRRWGDRRVWIASHVLMALGVGVLLVPGIAAGVAMALSALLVGGTFMVATMAGLQEARRLGGDAARSLIAALTAAFAAGQIAGPLVVSMIHNVAVSLAIAVFLLAASALVLRRIP